MNDWYVYILFDTIASPRYIGIARRHRRWLDHEIAALTGEISHKANVIRKILRLCGEVPKVKIRENLSSIRRRDSREDEVNVSLLLNYKAY